MPTKFAIVDPKININVVTAISAWQWLVDAGQRNTDFPQQKLQQLPSEFPSLFYYPKATRSLFLSSVPNNILLNPCLKSDDPVQMIWIVLTSK